MNNSRSSETKSYQVNFPYPGEMNEDITVYSLNGCPHSTNARDTLLNRPVENECDPLLQYAIYCIANDVQKPSYNGCITRDDIFNDEYGIHSLKKSDDQFYEYPAINDNGVENAYFNEEQYHKIMSHRTFPIVFVRKNYDKNGNQDGDDTCEMEMMNNEEFQRWAQLNL